MYLSRSKGRTLLIKVQLTSYEVYLSSRAKVSCLNSALLAALTKISSTSSFALPHHITTRVPRSPCNKVGRVFAQSSGYRRLKDKFCFTCQHVCYIPIHIINHYHYSHGPPHTAKLDYKINSMPSSCVTCCNTSSPLPVLF